MEAPLTLWTRNLKTGSTVITVSEPDDVSYSGSTFDVIKYCKIKIEKGEIPSAYQTFLDNIPNCDNTTTFNESKGQDKEPFRFTVRPFQGRCIVQHDEVRRIFEWTQAEFKEAISKLHPETEFIESPFVSDEEIKKTLESFFLFISHPKGPKNRLERFLEGTGSKKFIEERLGGFLIRRESMSDLSYLDALAEAGVDFNAQDKHGTVPLMYASKYQIRKLLKLGADPNHDTGAALGTPLKFAALRNAAYDSESVFELIKGGAEIKPDVTGSYSYLNKHDSITRKTLLMEAVISNDLSIFSKLLEHSADPNAKDISEKTVLMHAVKASGGENQLTIVSKLLEHGADPKARDNYGNTVLMHAVRESGETQLTIVSKLLEHGADPNAKDNDEKTVLMHAVAPDILSSHTLAHSGETQLEIISKLLEHGVDPNAKDKDGNTVLMHALKEPNGENRLAIISKLLEHGADPSHIDASNKHILIHIMEEIGMMLTFTTFDELSEDNRKYIVHKAEQVRVILPFCILGTNGEKALYNAFPKVLHERLAEAIKHGREEAAKKEAEKRRIAATRIQNAFRSHVAKKELENRRKGKTQSNTFTELLKPSSPPEDLPGSGKSPRGI